MSGSSVNRLGAIPASRGVSFRKRILAEHFSNPKTVLTFKFIHLAALAAPEGALAAPKEAPPPSFLLNHLEAKWRTVISTH